MPTFSAFTTLSSRHKAESLAEALEGLEPQPDGVGCFEMEDGSGLWEVGAYFGAAPDDTALALLAAVHDARPFVLSELPEIDWVAKVRRDLSPVEAGRFFIHGSHDADKVPAGRIALLIEAAMAFGTGHHGTTQGCLLALERLASAGLEKRAVIDVGCGTAVLGMGAARLWPHPVTAADIDAVAVEVAQANLAANGLEELVHCIEAAGFDHPDIGMAAPFDLILANILKGPLIDLAPDVVAHLAPDGHVVLSGLLREQADDVLAAYAAQGLRPEHREDIGDWTTLTLVRA